MQTEVISILKKTYLQYGTDIISDKKKLEAYFSDLLANYPREKRLLTIAAREDIFCHVLQDIGVKNYAKKGMYANIISSLYGIEEKVAVDVVEMIYLALLDEVELSEQDDSVAEESNDEKREIMTKLITVLNNYLYKINNQFMSSLKRISVDDLGEVDAFSERLIYIAKLKNTNKRYEYELVCRTEKILGNFNPEKNVVYDLIRVTTEKEKIISVRNDLEYYVDYMERNMKKLSFNQQLVYRSKISDILSLLYGSKSTQETYKEVYMVQENHNIDKNRMLFEERIKRIALLLKIATTEQIVIISKTEEILKTKDNKESEIVYDLENVVEDSKEIIDIYNELKNQIRVLYPHKSSVIPSEKYRVKTLLRKLYGNKLNIQN